MLKGNHYTFLRNDSCSFYDINTAKLRKAVKGSVNDEGTLQSVSGCFHEKNVLTFRCSQLHIDDSGRFALTTTSGDKTVNLVSLHSGDVLATGFGHSESVTNAVFVNVGKFVLTVSLACEKEERLSLHARSLRFRTKNSETRESVNVLLTADLSRRLHVFVASRARHLQGNVVGAGENNSTT